MHAEQVALVELRQLDAVAQRVDRRAQRPDELVGPRRAARRAADPEDAVVPMDDAAEMAAGAEMMVHAAVADRDVGCRASA